jgi:hypothetical protein
MILNLNVQESDNELELIVNFKELTCSESMESARELIKEMYDVVNSKFHIKNKSFEENLSRF